MRRVNRFFRVWWPLVLALSGAAVIVAMAIVTVTVFDDRAQLRAQRDQLTVQSQQLAEIIERSEEAEVDAQGRLQSALVEVEAVLIDHFARHDANVAQKLNETLHRIEVLLGRPAGTPPEPVAARPVPSRAPARTTAPSPRRTAPATRTHEQPATTTPSQKSCARRPGGPKC